MVENYSSDGTKTFLNPIIDWEGMFGSISENNIKYCSLYDEDQKVIVFVSNGNTS